VLFVSFVVNLQLVLQRQSHYEEHEEHEEILSKEKDMEKHGVISQGRRSGRPLRAIFSVLLVLAMMLAVGGCTDKGGDTAQPNPAASSTVAAGGGAAVAHFKEPVYTEKPMLRMWFPDATAGMDENDTIKKQIDSLAAAGFGGVELTMLADSSSYTNDQAAYCGWGTENWQKLLKKLFNAANDVEGGFRVDITITAHWPPTINTIDPNDTAAATEISSSVTKIRPGDLKGGAVELNLPKMKTTDNKSGRFIFTDTHVSSSIAKVTAVEGKKLTLDFGTLEKVKTDPVKLDSAAGLPAYAYRTIDGILYAGSPAGVPDKETCDRMGWTYQDIVDAFGPEPNDPNLATKQDDDGNRKRLADWQYHYKADLSGADLKGLNDDEEISAGDWVVVSAFYRGTGQVESGGASIVMHNRPYVMNYFDESGIQVIYDYWWEHIIDDELLAMLKANGGSIFEDSIESQTDSAYWTFDMYDEIKKQYAAQGGYPYTDAVAALVASENQFGGGRGGGPGGGMPMGDMFPGGGMPGGTGGEGMGGFPGGGPDGGMQGGPGGGMQGGPGGGMQGGPDGDMSQQGGMPPQGGMPGGTGGGMGGGFGGIPGGSGESSGDEAADVWTYAFDDSDPAVSDRMKRIHDDYTAVMGTLYLEQHIEKSNEFAHSFGYTYRAQAGGITGGDSGASALACDVVETDAAGKSAVSAVYMSGKKIYSKEAMAGMTVYGYNWEDLLIEFNSNFAFGYNRLIIHGSAYSKSINGTCADWPGWPPFTASFGEPYGYRQIYWDRMATVGNYIARNQAVLQNATNKIDVAVLGGGGFGGMGGGGSFTDTLLDNGYSFTEFTEALLHTENSVVTNKRIFSEGVGYKALIVNAMTTCTVASMEKIEEFAKAGLPIIFIGDGPSAVTGTETEANNGEKVREVYVRLTGAGYSNVLTLSSSDDVLNSLKNVLGVKGYASYSIPNLETLVAQDKTDGTRYYYLFNNTTTNNMMPSAYAFKQYKTKDIEAQWITLEGEGTPYVLDALTGGISQAGQYRDNGDGTLSILLDGLKGGESTIIAVTTNEADFPSASRYVTSVDADPESYAVLRGENGDLVFRSNEPGTYQVTFSDGSAKTVTVADAKAPVDLTDANWQLAIDSYGPTYKDAEKLVDPETGIQTVDPSDTTIARVDFGTRKLATWSDIQATPQQLETMGVSNMNEVSGKGFYTTTISWDDEAGAYLSFVYLDDMVTALTVNGTEITAVNNVTDTVDIGDYLVPGDNAVTIELSTTLNNRAKVESDTMKSLRVKPYGLTRVVLNPYYDVEL